MVNLEQIPPVLLARAVNLMISGRVHFPDDRIGECVTEEEPYKIFRKVVVDPSPGQPERPGAIFKVCFHFAKFSINTNITLSWIPVPFIIAQPGFRSKTWLIGQETGIFQGLYEFDTVADAENYWTSFPLKLMKKRAIPASLTYSIVESSSLENS